MQPQRRLINTQSTCIRCLLLQCGCNDRSGAIRGCVEACNDLHVALDSSILLGDFHELSHEGEVLVCTPSGMLCQEEFDDKELCYFEVARHPPLYHLSVPRCMLCS